MPLDLGSHLIRAHHGQWASYQSALCPESYGRKPTPAQFGVR
jgi:hypothetical protein